jgi:ankyrin repeat protein
MNEFITALEEENTVEAIELLGKTPELLSQKSEDGWSALQLAAFYNNPTVTEYLLNNSTYEQINDVKVHPIIVALEEKNEEVIQSFLNFADSNKINWNAKETTGDNLLYLSIHYGLDKFVDDFVAKGLSSFEKNNQGLSAISLIIDKGDVSLFDRLNDNNKLTEHYDDVLIKKSIQHDHLEIFERLHPYTELSPDELFGFSSGFNSVKVMNNILESGDIIPGMEQITKIVDLMCRNYEKHEEIEAAKSLADFLFEVKIPFNKFVNEKGQTAWMLCIQNNNEHVFKRLMNSTENVNTADNEQHSPLFYAVEKNNANFVKILLKKKANPNQEDRAKNTPLIKAVERGSVEIVKELLKYGAKLNELNASNEHALSIAIKKRRMDIVTELIWAGGEITTNPVKFVEEKHMFFFSPTGDTERNTYYDEEHIDNFISLARLGFRLDQRNEVGDTFLLHFIKNGYMSNFSALMRCQFNPNQIDAEGDSALMCSMMKRQDEYFNTLLKRFDNLDLSHKNNDGKNIYDLCLKVNKIDRMEKLLDYDSKLTLENAQKAAKMIAKDGSLSKCYDKLAKAKLDLTFEDENQNTLLMFSLAGGNLENFKYLIEEIGVPVDLQHKNKFGHSLEDIINAMPPEVGKDFSGYLTKNLKKKA